LPVVGFLNGGSADAPAGLVVAFRKALNDTGFVEGQNVTIEYYWLEGQYGKLPALTADLVRRRVAVIVTPDAIAPSNAAKAATATIPIVFGIGDDPVKLGLVASFARPGGHATGINLFLVEVMANSYELMPKAVRPAANQASPVNRVNDLVRRPTAQGSRLSPLSPQKARSRSLTGRIQSCGVQP
jgi:putative ABC transport system substrate-binding protein